MGPVSFDFSGPFLNSSPPLTANQPLLYIMS